MKAPDKIFVPTRFRLVDGLRVRNSDTDEEYIRKDALLEWARKKNKRIDTEEGDYSLGYVSAMIDLIDKINAM